MKDMKSFKREEKWVTLTHLKFKGNASIHALYFKPNWMGQSWHKKLMIFPHSWGLERWKSWKRGGPSPTGNRPWPAPWHEQWAAGVAVCLQDQEEVLQGVQEEAHGPDQKLWKKKKEAPTNETRCGRDPPQENGHRPRDDWHHCWCSQRQGLHTGWGQVRDDWTLLRRVLHLLQTTKRTTPMWLSKFHASSNQNAPWIQPLHPLPTTIPHKLYTCYSNFNSLSVSWNYLGRPVLEEGRDEWQCHSSNEMCKLCGDYEL